MRACLLAALMLSAAPLGAAAPANPQIDYPGFAALTSEVASYRAARLLDWRHFAAMAKQKDVLLLDARSAQAFAEGHIAGAVNLPLPDFTADSLAATIGRADRPILIYCNNNFSNNARPVPLKRAALSLNIQTFINLVGYGYRNVHELGEVIDFTSADVPWVKVAG
jgi:hypothetical protein